MNNDYSPRNSYTSPSTTKIQPNPASEHIAVTQAYGLFMIAWSIVEGMLQAAIQKELGISPEKAVIITGKLQFNQRAQMLIGLLKLHGDRHTEAIKILNKFEGFAKRNAMVHGMVIIGVPGELTFVKYDGGATSKVKFTALELSKHTVALTQRIDVLKEQLGISDGDIQKIGDATFEFSAKQ